MAGSQQDRVKIGELTVTEAKARLKSRSDLRPSLGIGVASTVVERAERHPWRAVATGLALGIAVGYSRGTRRLALSVARRALGLGS